MRLGVVEFMTVFNMFCTKSYSYISAKSMGKTNCCKGSASREKCSVHSLLHLPWSAASRGFGLCCTVLCTNKSHVLKNQLSKGCKCVEGCSQWRWEWWLAQLCLLCIMQQLCLKSCHKSCAQSASQNDSSFSPAVSTSDVCAHLCAFHLLL